METEGGGFGTAPVTLPASRHALKTQVGNGINVIVKNADSTGRTVHGQNGFAHFAHGDGPVAPGTIENKVRVINAGANASGYLQASRAGRPSALSSRSIRRPDSPTNLYS